MEQSLRLLLTSNSKPTEQSLLNVFNKLTSPSGSNFSSDLFILLAERFFDLQHSLQKHIVDKAEIMVQTYNRLQEPMNQFQVRSLIIQSLIFNYRASQHRGTVANDLNLKAIDFIHRALKAIQSTTLYQPLSLRAVFIFYQVALPFFPAETRSNLQAATPIALQLLESHVVSDKFDSTMRLYIALSLLNGCLLDDIQKSDEASKQLQKLFTMIPQDQTLLRFSLLHVLTHFSRKSPGGIMKVKLDLNDQLQKAVIMYQSARSNNATQTKDLGEAFKICTTYLDSKKETPDENNAFETLIGEIGRLAAQFGQTQLAQECYQRASNARYPLGRCHAILINAELAFANDPSPDERADVIATCSHCMSLAQGQGDLALVQDAATLLWNHSILILNRPGLIKRHLLTAVDILQKCGSQANLMRSEMHFTLAKIFEADRDNAKALDQLKKAISLDYLVNDHPSKLQHPFDRFLMPFQRMLNVQQDAFGTHVEVLDQAFAPIVQSRRPNSAALKQSYDILSNILPDDVAKFDAVDAAHFASVWCELIKAASQGGQCQYAVDACKKFLEYEFDIVQYDAAVEVQCESVVYAISAAIVASAPQEAVSFLQFALNKGKLLKMPRLLFNAISSIWNSLFSKQDPAACGDYVDILNDCITTLFETDFEPCKQMIGQFVNFFVQVLLELCAEPPGSTQGTKKKASQMDQTKQKQLKMAEDTALKSISYLTSIYEKKALVDRIVEIFAKKNALPPNQSDPETSTLIQLATIMNDKVQHKQETLSSIFSSIQNLNCPALYAILSERSNKLDIGQLTIDSASKYIELIPEPSSKDELYYAGLARFNRGSANLKSIQPDLQEFSCQDKLRVEAANDFLKASQYFNKAQSIDNAKISLSFFCSTVSVGENFPKFRTFIADILAEALQLSKQVIIGDDMRVSLYKIYLQVLIDQKDWQQCRKTIHDAISSLEKGVISQLWELNLVVTAKADCSKSDSPLIDEMLRVKQLGDSKYQSRLWSFVVDLAHDVNIQEQALTKATEVLKETDVMERFKTSMDHAKWLHLQDRPWEQIDEKLKAASLAAADEQDQIIQMQRRFEIELFKLKSTKVVADFENAAEAAIRIISGVWTILSELNQTVAEEDQNQEKRKSSARKQKPNDPHKTSQTPKEEPSVDFKTKPSTIAAWQELMKQIDKHKLPNFENPYSFVMELLEAIDLIQLTGREFQLMVVWYICMAISKLIVRNNRLEQLILTKFAIFLDRLDNESQLPYNNDFSITDEERSEWNQKVERYQEDPPSDSPPLRNIMLMQCWPLLELGDYRSVITMADIALSQAEQLNDSITIAEANAVLAIVNERSGTKQKAVNNLSQAANNEGLPYDVWVKWFIAAFDAHGEENRSAYVSSLCAKFKDLCIHDNMTISDIILAYNVYSAAIPLLNDNDLSDLYNDTKGFIIMPSMFMPSIDLRINFISHLLHNPNFPKDIVEYKLFGNEMLKFIESVSLLYQNTVENELEASIPQLIRYVTVVNLFAELVVLYRPKILDMKVHGLDYSVIGSHDDIINEFIDKDSEPLVDLSTTAAILHFNSVQCLQNIPLKQATNLNWLMGKCLHSIATDVVTKQNAVKFLWKSVPQLEEIEDYKQAENIAKELVDLLHDSDISGTIQMFINAQNDYAYQSRIDYLKNETPSENREYLYVEENYRIAQRFNKPQISQMFLTTQRYFKEIPSGTALFRAPFTMENLKPLFADKKILIFVVDNTGKDRELEGTIIAFGEKDLFIQERLSIDLDAAAMKVEIFKQIIAPPKKPEPKPEEPDEKKKETSSPRGKKGKKDKKQQDAKLMQPQPSQVEFGSIASKIDNPEFVAFIKDLSQKFEPISQHIPEGYDNILFVSSMPSFHTIPFTAVEPFSKFNTMYHDYSIVSAISRKKFVTTLTRDI